MTEVMGPGWVVVVVVATEVSQASAVMGAGGCELAAMGAGQAALSSEVG